MFRDSIHQSTNTLHDAKEFVICAGQGGVHKGILHEEKQMNTKNDAKRCHTTRRAHFSCPSNAQERLDEVSRLSQWSAHYFQYNMAWIC